MRKRNTLSLIAVSVAVLAITAIVYAHGGGLDSQGGHHDRKRGGYHFHRGPLVGQTFSSKSSSKALSSQYRTQSRKNDRERRTTHKPTELKPLSVDDKLLVLVQLLENNQVLEKGEFEKAITKNR